MSWFGLISVAAISNFPCIPKVKRLMAAFCFCPLVIALRFVFEA
jgi:hypothetical protein